MKIVFFGTPDYVVPILEAVRNSLVAVVTQSPKASGRDKKLTFSPVDSWAFKRRFPIFHQSEEINENAIEADLGILAAYGEIIPESVIEKFKFGILNIHPSLLPRFRGASPIQAALCAGLEETGVTIIKLDSKLDHGPIISQFRENILPNDTCGTLKERLFVRGAQVLAELIEPYLKGKIKPRAQVESKASYTIRLVKSHGFIPPKYLAAALLGKSLKESWPLEFVKDFTQNPTPHTLDCFIRAMDPWPTSWTLVQLNSKSEARNTKRLKILKAHLEEKKLVLDEVQLEGKDAVNWKEFQRGYPTATLE